MQSEAYKLSGFTIVISALGFLLRWLQDMRIQNPETGLPAHAAISFWVAGCAVVTAILLAVLILRLKQFDAPVAAEQALAGHTMVYTAISLLPAAVLALSGIYRALRPGDVLWPTMHRVCGIATLLGAFGAGTLALNIAKPGEDGVRRRGAVLMMVFAVVWLVTGYRDAATDPITWRFVVGLLAESAALLAIYYISGYFFNSAHPWMTLFFCEFGAFLCIMSAIDDNGAAQSAAFAAMAVQLLIWAFVVTENLRTKPLTPEGPEQK